MRIQTIKTNGRVVYLFTSEGKYVTTGNVESETLYIELNNFVHHGRKLGKEWRDRVKNALLQYQKEKKIKLIIKDNEDEQLQI